jgi:hypothetical protein
MEMIHIRGWQWQWAAEVVVVVGVVVGGGGGDKAYRRDKQEKGCE